MANELHAAYTSGKTLYAVILNAAGSAWYTVTPAFEVPTSTHWTSYAIAAAEIGSTGIYEASMPAGISAAGTYEVVFYRQAGGSPAVGDAVVASGRIQWSGTAEFTPVTTDSAGKVALTGAEHSTVQTDVTSALTTQGYTAARGPKLDNLDAAVSTRSTFAGGAVASVTDRTGFKLASDGLDQISVADPGAPASWTTFPSLLVALHRRFFKKVTLTSSQLRTYADDGTTVNSTQTVTDDGTTQTQGAAS